MISRKSLAIALLTIVALAVPTAANAATGTPVGGGTTPTVVTTVPLSITGFDASIAASNGYELRLNDAGQHVVVKAGEATSTGTVVPEAVLNGTAKLSPLAAGAVSPMGTVTGNCGSSSVFLTNPSILKYHVDTGFYVVTPAISYSWAVQVTGPGYLKNHTWGGGLLFRSTWTGTADANISQNQAGAFYAYASGSATLANGIICQSLHPTDLEYIY